MGLHPGWRRTGRHGAVRGAPPASDRSRPDSRPGGRNGQVREGREMAGDPGATSGAPDARRQPEPIRVLIVDDHALFRRGLEMVLAEEPDVEVVGEASDG